jgi:hypothetical protein
VHVRVILVIAFQPCKYFCSTARKSILLSELKVKMLLFFKYNYFLKRKTAIDVFFGSYRKGKYSNMLFLAVEQKYLHGWKAGDVKILYL